MKKIVLSLLLAISLAGCDHYTESTAQEDGQKQTEQAFGQQSNAVPYPVDQLKDSLERRNLKERLLRQNNPSRVGYVYFVSFGKFLGYWTIKGKVSSTQSQMTTDQLIVECRYTAGCENVVSAPGDDGSYGPNERGVFFFTTEGTMIQLPEDSYVYSDQPIALGDIPELNSAKK